MTIGCIDAANQDHPFDVYLRMRKYCRQIKTRTKNVDVDFQQAQTKIMARYQTKISPMSVDRKSHSAPLVLSSKFQVSNIAIASS